MSNAPSIKVAVRIRPPTSWEAGRLPEAPTFEDLTLRGEGSLTSAKRPTNTPLSHILRVTDQRLLVFDPPDEDTARAFKERGFLPPGTKRYKDRRFLFDRVFDTDAQQRDVFEETAKPLLDGLFDGYNATVFAYGATGCGKTYTISGTDYDPGLIYLTMAELFQQIEDRKDELVIDVAVTFLEIYNEEIRDLLAEPGSTPPRGGLVIREDKAVKVSGLTELRPVSAEEVKQIVLAGNLRRTQSPTHANETSSRSHAVLQIHLTTSPRTADTTEMHRMATLSIIDLAGSERASATKNMGERMVEGANINKSLLALGNCINALCEAGGRKVHVPYRNSKLTRLLKFSLGGNCKTVMIVCVAPASNHFDDTHNTLVYAERAKKIKTKTVTANYINVDRHVGQYVEAINRLNAEVAELKAKLAGKLGAEAEITKRRQTEAKAEVERAKSDMDSKLEQSRGSIMEGATCQASLNIAQSKVQAIRRRMAEIDAISVNGILSSDLQAERALLLSLLEPEEQILHADSAFRARLRKASNTSSMFDATLKAMCQRRHDKLDDVALDNVALDAKAKRAVVEQVKAEAEANAYKAVVERQTELLTNLTGILARCTVMLKDSSQRLLTAAASPETLETVTQSLPSYLQRLAEANDASFATLFGSSTSSYVPNAFASSLSSFAGYAKPAPISAYAGPSITTLRRSPRHLSNETVSSPRKSKSPRKSSAVRSAVPLKEKKSLRWKDEAGQGDLHEGPIFNASSVGIDSSVSQQTSSVAGSESDWEDEKPEDSSNISVSMTSTTGTAKRPRSSRLDPGYLKASKSSLLASLPEIDSPAMSILGRHSGPLSDRGNQMDMDSSDSFSLLAIPKGKNSSATPRMPSSMARSNRRRSQIGPIRSEKTSRRRSSLIPQPSPPHGSKTSVVGGARRVPIESVRSPAKRAKRNSLLSVSRAGRSSRTSVSSPSDQNATLFFPTNGSKPTWK
ncbi:hypothetical protein M422DRAFT_22805 [Sphaerobolus stellatus SS14]|nr:hypothetical protein M422DRAFT_22805 [Sphaerobolus stellatus SS14]